MTVTVITPSVLQILVISSCDQYYPLNELTAHNLATRILDLGARGPLEGLGVNMLRPLAIPSQDKTTKRLVLV
jgi:hypothetical protein